MKHTVIFTDVGGNVTSQHDDVDIVIEHRIGPDAEDDYLTVTITLNPEQPLTKPSIDWSHVHEDFKWLTRDADGTISLHDGKPTHNATWWRGVSRRRIVTGVITSYQPGTCDWKDSLVERPTNG